MKSHLVVALSALATAVVADAVAQQTTATLRITVEKRIYGEKTSRPLHGVGTFDLIRGSAALDGAKCPDKSGPTGQVTCVIPCKRTDSIPMVLRVRPPSDQDVLAGWVAPVAKDIEVDKCVVKPTTLTMVYEDARFALNEFLSKQYFAAGSGGGGGGGGTIAGKFWIGEVTNESAVVAKFSAASGTPIGRAELLEVHRLATEAASAPFLQSADLPPEDKRLADALARWQVLTKSALLSSQVSLALPPR